VRGARVGGGVALLGALPAGCGGDEESAGTGTGTGTGAEKVELSGTLDFNTYPNWIGASEYEEFKALHPDVTVKEHSVGVGSVTEIAQTIQRDPDAYDFLLLGRAGCPQLEQSGHLAELDYSKIPNIKNVPQRFRTDYPWGIPTDYGKTGYAYRKDLISERPTTWGEFFDLAPKYSGKVILSGVLEDCIGNTLKSLGYSANSVEPAELEEAKNLLIDTKPHVQAFLAAEMNKPLINGSAVMGMDWDFEVALAQQEQPNVVWVLPEEGLTGYLEGWVAVGTSDALDEVQAFMDFHLDPPNFADFINTTGSANLMPDAVPLIKPEIRDNPILAFDEEVLELVEFGEFHGEATQLWNETWNEVQAA
jgi:spermidine/putrescine transport system substrate-binding protein